MNRKKYTLKLTLLVFLSFFVANFSNAQFGGKLNKLKDKTKDKTSGNVVKGKYEKSMEAAREYEKEGNYIEAHRSYRAALEEKTNDYQASSGQKNVESKAQKQYKEKYDVHVKNNDCDSYSKVIEDMLSNMIYSPRERETWEHRRDNCEEILKEMNAGKQAESNKVEAQEKLASMEGGKGQFYKSFAGSDYTAKSNIGDDLYVRFKFDKTMIESGNAGGLDYSHYAYGFITIYFDGKKSEVIGPISFDSRISKKWTHIDVPLNVDKKLAEELQKDQSKLSTQHDIWVFQNLYSDHSTFKKYVSAAVINSKEGTTHDLKVEFGLGGQEDKEPKITTSKGEIKLVADKDGLKKLYKNGPKYLQPIEDHEVGKLEFSKSSFTPGEDEVTAKLSLPEPPKYYNMKWCQPMSCDYDHGNLVAAVWLDGEKFKGWVPVFWNEAYDQNKEFSFVVFPKTDKGLDDVAADFNKPFDFFKSDGINVLTYYLLEKIYNNELKPGKHQLRIKFYSPEVIPMNVSDYPDEKTQTIAENTIEINVTEAGIKKLISSSSAKKLSHAGGEWTSVDNHLKNSSSSILDAACYTEWKIIKNSLGHILHKECKASIVYSNKEGTRITHGLVVKADYSGGGEYGKPYFDSGINDIILSPGNYPVPLSKVK